MENEKKKAPKKGTRQNLGLFPPESRAKALNRRVARTRKVNTPQMRLTPEAAAKPMRPMKKRKYK